MSMIINAQHGIKYAALAALALASIASLQGCGRESLANSATPPYLHQVTTQSVRLQPNYRIEREFAGEVQAGQSSRLGFELPGVLESLMVNVGDTVAEGELLARLDTSLLDSERAELTAQRAELSAELDTTRRNLARIEQLRSEQLASERERDELQGRTRVLEASLQRVDAALQANRTRFEKSELRAPFDAAISSRLVDLGVVVDAGQPVFALEQSLVREVRAGVPVTLANTLLAGQSVRVRAGQAVADGQIIGLNPVVDQATRSRTVRIRISEAWAPGELAYLQLDMPVQKTGAWLPDSAVTEGARGTWVVYAAVDSGDARWRLETRSVVIHHVRGDELFVSGALNDRDRVVSAGLHRLAPGQLVRVSETTELAAALP
ncbi:MAG: efflux RND transporter periplasmic adaptor subunit [Xanthomonadales bacterium]|nr:efflux RND transporter periplasmic adaptor subunit [Xanthomonadales bacterium]